MQSNQNQHARGFTLIEMMVAVALFAIVMLVATSALLALMNATRKAQALQSVMNNLNTALDGMVRAIRMGDEYYCGGISAGTNNCTGGSTLFSFAPYGTDATQQSTRWAYRYNATNKSIEKSVNGGASFVAITAPEIQVDDFKFYVVGTTRSDSVQPRALIVVKGTAGDEKVGTRTTFSIQATAVQRLLDI